MIASLTVENLAIIERAELRFHRGLTVFTGETGAGKSLLIDAIGLALGDRSDADLVRHGASKATVRLEFNLDEHVPLSLLDLAAEAESLLIQREVWAEGRSMARINAKVVPATSLRALGSLLIDLHGQHDHQSLMDPQRHIHLLDDWIGVPARELIHAVEGTYTRLSEVERRLSSLRSGMRDRERRLDLLRFQVDEIEAVSPLPDEFADIETQLARLQNFEKIADAVASVLSTLVEQENSVSDQLAVASKQLESCLRHDPSMEGEASELRDAAILVAEVSQRLRRYFESLEADPAVLEQVAGRLDALRRLRRKYGANEVEILSYLASAREQLELLTVGEAGEADLEKEVAVAKEELDRLCDRLTTVRLERASDFAECVQSELRDLAMDRAQFLVDRNPKPPDATGADLIVFHFSANLGEPPRPLSRIASGGELSRVMLAIKTAMAGRAGVPTLIFDEVDAGLGGRAAVTVAKKLAALSRHYQVLVISHLPQIASQADHQLKIEKVESDGRVKTVVRPVSGEERVEEIARMLAGDRYSPAVLASARELLGERC